jgi:hypothetical protein
MKNKTPNFLVIGVQKSGTTWIYHVLKQHPEIFIPKYKELHFFDLHFHKGYNWYKKYFKKSYMYNTSGELTPDYVKRGIAQRIYNYNGNMKIILVLRNPIDRSYSAYKHEIIHRGNTAEFLQQFESDFGNIQSYGYYFKIISEYYRYFPKEQVKIVFYDDIIKNPMEICNQIFSFLEVRTNIKLKRIHKRRHSTLKKLPVKPLLSLLVFLYSLNRKYFEYTSLRYVIYGLIRIIKIISNYIPFLHRDFPIFDEETKERIIKYYTNDIHKLSSLLNIDLSNWLEIK